MNHNFTGVNNLNGINSNIMNKFNKVNRKNYKTLAMNNNNASNYIQNIPSKDIIQQSISVQEKRKKSVNTKILNNKKEKKNYIPKTKLENTDTQILFNNNETNFEISHHRINSNKSQKKKEMVQRQASLSQKKLIITNNKKQKDLNFIRKKLIIGNVPLINCNNNSNRYLPSSNDLFLTNENNSGKYIKRSNTNSNINENKNNMDYFAEIFKYKNIIKILVFYIENMNKKIKYFFNKIQIEKNNKIKELSMQNKFLLNENKTLKFKLIQMFYAIKSYINSGIKTYDEKYLKIIKDTINENKFLRSINILPKNINNTYLSQLQKQIQIEKMKKELLIHKQFTEREENNQNNNQSNSKVKKDNNNILTNDDTSLNDLNKMSHRRQRTHFNLGKLNEENSTNSINRDSIGSNNNNNSNTPSENTSIENKNKEKESLILKHIKNKAQYQNILSDTLKDMNNHNKSFKKINNNNSKKIISENKKENELNNKNINDNNTNTYMKENKIIKEISSNNIPVNMNKIEYINYSSEKKNKSNNIKNDSERKNDEYINGNEMIGNKKQQPIYYRSSREKEKKKLTFNK